MLDAVRWFPLVVLVASLAAGCQTAAAPARPAGHVEIVEAPPGTTDVAALVRLTLARTGAEQRRLVVYVGATWCEPCQQIHAAILSHGLDQTFPDLTLLEFDLDRDGKALAAAGYSSPLIPLFDVPGPDGRAGPRHEFGGKHGIDNVQLLTAKLHRLLDPQG